MAEWFKDPVTYQVMLWSFILFTVMAAIGGIEIAHSPRGLVTGIVVGGLGAGAMVLGLGFTRLFLGLFFPKKPLEGTRIAAFVTGAIFVLIGLRFVLGSLSPGR
jgi:hypothetical protein